MSVQIRSSDVFLKADIAALLRALSFTAHALSTAESAEFVRGYLSAIAAIATALNVAPGDVGRIDVEERW